MRKGLLIILAIGLCQVLAVSGAALKSDLSEPGSVAGRRAHKIFPPLWLTTKKPPIFTVPSWPWPKDWPWPKPGGPWPGPWCLSCPKPGMLDKLKERINPVEIKGGLDKIRQTIGVAGP